MELFKRKNSKNWHFKFTFEGRKIERTTGHSTKRKALEYAEGFKTSLRSGNLGLITKVETVTFKKAVEDFFKRAGRELAHTTIRRYKEASPHLVKFFGSKRINHIKTTDVQNYVNKRSKEYAFRPGKTLKNGTIKPPQKTDRLISSASINKELTLLKKLIGKFVDLEIITKNPAKPIKKLKEDNEAGRVINNAEEKLYLSKCNHDFRDYVILLLETAMRPNELCEMKLSNVSLKNRTFFVEEGKTKAARRFIPITNRALEVVTRRLNNPQGVYLFPGGRHNKSPVKPILKYNNAHYSALKKSKIDKENRTGTDDTCTLYSMRHTFATRFVESGGNLITLAAIMGHSDIRLLIRYSHPSDSHKFDAINFMSERQELMKEKEEAEEKEKAANKN